MRAKLFRAGMMGLLSAALGVGSFTVDVLVSAEPAEAVVGRPLTPVSVAGTARRTSRRVTRRHVAGAAAVTTAAVATTAAVGTAVAALPGGCTTVVAGGVTYHQCAGAYYQPVFQSGQVVYVVVDPPS